MPGREQLQLAASAHDTMGLVKPLLIVLGALILLPWCVAHAVPQRAALRSVGVLLPGGCSGADGFK